MRREKSLRIDVHIANAVVWEAVYRTHLTGAHPRSRAAVANDGFGFGPGGGPAPAPAPAPALRIRSAARFTSPGCRSIAARSASPGTSGNIARRVAKASARGEHVRGGAGRASSAVVVLLPRVQLPRQRLDLPPRVRVPSLLLLPPPDTRTPSPPRVVPRGAGAYTLSSAIVTPPHRPRSVSGAAVDVSIQANVGVEFIGVRWS